MLFRTLPATFATRRPSSNWTLPEAASMTAILGKDAVSQERFKECKPLNKTNGTSIPENEQHVFTLSLKYWELANKTAIIPFKLVELTAY
jgi:hypothetical protein